MNKRNKRRKEGGREGGRKGGMEGGREGKKERKERKEQSHCMMRVKIDGREGVGMNGVKKEVKDRGK